MLKNVLRLNATSCFVFGVLFLCLPGSVAAFLSPDHPAPVVIISILGAGLILNGGHLLWASLKPAPSRLLITYFAMGDFLWVAGTAFLMITSIWINSFQGTVTALVVAVMVAIFGYLQIRSGATSPS